MKPNKTRLISAGALIASLIFYAGTITTPAEATPSPSVQKWANAYVSMSKSFLADYTALETATTSNDIPGAARVCGKLQNLGFSFSSTNAPNDKTLNALNQRVINTLSSLATQCFVAVSNPTTANGTKLGQLINAFGDLSTPILARITQLKK